MLCSVGNPFTGETKNMLTVTHRMDKRNNQVFKIKIAWIYPRLAYLGSKVAEKARKEQSFKRAT